MRPQWLDRRLFPFESRFVELDGCRMHYVDEGEGRPLLLLHGNPTWSFLYRDIIKRLRHRFRCIAPDYPGFGLSSAREGYGFTPAEHARVIEHFLLELDLSGITMMVQDWGGPIGLAVAGRQPVRFSGLVIANTWAWQVDGDPRFELFSRLMGGPIGGFAIRNYNAFVELGLPLGTRRRLPQEVMEAYRGPFPERVSREPTHVLPREILGGRQFLSGVESGLQRLRHLPALIVWGDEDPAFRKPEREHFEQSFPNHRTRVLHGAGHFVQEDAPEEIAEEILNFFG